MTASSLGDALHYAEKFGWYIFPTRLVPRHNGGLSKVPCVKNWPNIASSDPNQIRQWWRQFPDAVPSLVTGAKNNIIILDIDIKTDAGGTITRSGLDTLEELGWWCWPSTPTVHTRSGGLHAYFRAAKFKIRNSSGRYGLGPNVDVRGWNGQVVLPAATSNYSWDPVLNFDTVAMLPAPNWFDHRQRKAPPTRSASGDRARFDPAAVLAEACHRIRFAVDGERHDTYRQQTFKIARLAGLGLIDARTARHDLMVEVMALGKIADGHTGKVEKYFNDAWAKGLAAAGAPRRSS